MPASERVDDSRRFGTSARDEPNSDVPAPDHPEVEPPETVPLKLGGTLLISCLMIYFCKA